MSIIDRAIEIHGAKKVYDAVYHRMQTGKSDALNAVGLGANTIGDAHEVMSVAYDTMTPTEQAQDYWEASRELNELTKGDDYNPLKVNYDITRL